MSCDNNEAMMNDTEMTFDQKMAMLKLQSELRRRRLDGETEYEGVPIDILISNDEVEETKEAEKEQKKERKPVVETAVRRVARIHRKIRDRQQKIATKIQKDVNSFDDKKNKKDETSSLSFFQRIKLRRQIKQIELAMTAMQIKKIYQEEMKKEDE